MRKTELLDGLLLFLLIVTPLSSLSQNRIKQPFGFDETLTETSKPSAASSEIMSAFGNDVNLYVSSYDQDQPTISSNPTDSLNLAAGSQDQSTAKPAGTTLWTITYRSLDGGASWSKGYVPRAGPLASFGRAGNPVVDFDGFGNAYCVGTALMRGADYDVSVWVAKSTDGGLAYGTPAMMDEGNGYPSPFFEMNDQPWIATDKRTVGAGAGYVYVTWTSFVDLNGDGSPDTYHILFSRSTDGGATFSTPTQVSDAGNWRNRLSRVAVGPNGEIYVSWINWNLPTARILFDKSTDFGASFGVDIEAQSFNQIPNLQYIQRTPPSMSMAVDKSGGAYNGYIYIAYPEDPPSTADKSDIMFTCSINGGDTWSTPVKLNDDATSNDQFFPAVAVDPLGSIKAAWFDRRLDSENRYIDVFLTESNDGGASLAANTRVTDTNFDPAGAFLGDYIDIDASEAQVHPIWTDRRNGNNDVYTEYAPSGHELSVSLQAPAVLEPADSAQLNATVYNIGSNNETNVQFLLLINGTVVNSTVIPELPTGSSYTVSHSWSPQAESIYNVTAYVPPLPEEVLTLNNAAWKYVQVEILPDILVVADDDAPHWITGTSLSEFESALTSARYDYWVWNESSMGRPSEGFLLKFKLVIWTSGDYWGWAVDPIDAATLQTYFNRGGNILLEGEDIGYDHGSDSFMVNVAHASFEVDYTEALGLTVTDRTHSVTQNLPQSLPWLTVPPSDDGVVPTHGGFEVIRYTSTSWTAVTLFDGVGTSNGSVVYYAFPIYSLAQPERENLIINSVNWLLPPIARFTHSPEKPSAGEVVIFNATLSTPNDGIIATYEWDFGDTNTTTTTNPTITHRFNVPGNYNVTLTVTDSEGKSDTSWAIIAIYLIGDVDRDRDVDASDLFYFSKAYGSDPSKPNWRQECDFNEDNRVDASDLFSLSKNFGKAL
ncbi:MAG TPA: PKD domain-containing protein [Candidatus Bathyarchaeia archaeon]|nr:PKD domain-containing protein [Candidatus Bathyarchaeia archaeon]